METIKILNLVGENSSSGVFERKRLVELLMDLLYDWLDERGDITLESSWDEKSLLSEGVEVNLVLSNEGGEKSLISGVWPLAGDRAGVCPRTGERRSGQGDIIPSTDRDLWL